LLAGGIFGLLQGTFYVSVGSTMGATLSFLMSRYLFQDFFKRKFASKTSLFIDGFEKEGGFYLFTLRLLPVFPFFLVNILMGITGIRVLTYALISWVGMLPGTLVYVNAGLQLASLTSLSGILSMELFLSFAALSLLPWAARFLIGILKHRKLYRDYPRPQSFDYNLIVLGAGAAGLISAYIAAAVKAKVLLIERAEMGGDCLNTGCVPSKSMLRAAHLLHDMRSAKAMGLDVQVGSVDFVALKASIQKKIQAIAPNDSVERYESLGVHCLKGSAVLKSPYSVEINGQTLTARHLILATGAEPIVPKISGLETVRFVTSETVWNLESLPKRLLVMGGGAIGCELAYAFAHLGSQVTIVEMAPQLLPREDPDVAQVAADSLTAAGVSLQLEAKVLSFGHATSAGVTSDYAETSQGRIPFDVVLLALGRKARTENMGFTELKIEKNTSGTLKADALLRTNYPNIFVAGDVTGPLQLTHVAGHQAWFAAVNALFSPFARMKIGYDAIPMVTYIHPEIARVGLTEKEAFEKGLAFETHKFPMAHLDRAITDGMTEGFVKVILAEGKGQILGAVITAPRAGEMLAEFTLAIRKKLSLNDIMGTVHPYPTYSEASKMVAGVWQKSKKRERTLKWLARYHAWRRG
jgi:pyruvate/2-oxoglutarate dehydrogenase complex dihydrolipoamide dehydrogenase (E3) component/membrane protein DedA with SNARE-associated domain